MAVVPVMCGNRHIVQHGCVYGPQEDAAVFKQRDIVIVNTVIL